MQTTTTRVGEKYAAIVGDVIDSRSHADQGALIGRLTREMTWVNERVPAVQSLSVTVGDEFQGAYEGLGSALSAALMIRLRLQGFCDLRIGIGWGAISSFDPDREPLAQSGPAWWAAREAIERVASLGTKRNWPRSVMTQIGGASAQLTAVANSMLLCRDALLAAMDDRDAQILLGLFEGQSQKQIAKGLEVSQPSVSARQADKGISAVYQAHRMLEDLVS